MSARTSILGRATLTAAVTLAASTIATPAATAKGTTPAACAATAVFETDGYQAGETLSSWNGSRFNANPPAGWEIVQVPYYAGIFPVVDRRTLDDSVIAGGDALYQRVTGYHAACPGTRLVLSGYSEGALIAGEALRRLAASPAIPHQQVNGVLYGDPRRDFGDGGTGGTAGGIETNLPTILPGVTMRGGATYGDLAVRDVCNENDGICNSANMITNLAAFANGLVGYASGDHAYDLNPARDLGSGLILNRQPPRLPYGPPLPIRIGTPWQLQQGQGGNAGRAEAAQARNALRALIGQPALDRLADTSPWYRLLAGA